MSLDIPVCKNSPLRRMFPCVIPSGLGEARTSSVDSLDGRGIADTILIRSQPHDGAILFMQGNIVVFESSTTDTVEVP